jgi:hypothetical protein
MEPEGSLPCTQESATDPNPQLDESSPHTFPLYFPKVQSYVIFPSNLGLPNCPFTLRFSDQNLARISHLYHACSCPAHLIVLNLVTLILFGETSYEAPHDAVFSSLPPLHPSQVKIFSSAPCSEIPFINFVHLAPRLMMRGALTSLPPHVLIA